MLKIIEETGSDWFLCIDTETGMSQDRHISSLTEFAVNMFRSLERIKRIK